ncbi:butyrophilin subfamily 1 member A1-like [Perca fluviatilis]|uniref:butyrophilin subfamily 1 member A1-like n=1 Tax=Perca fluviatilis TaxID=8168 RepID=UPI0019638D01|nr:butyrophilin subfamily 1 member A1-like [Perca fluviatilis]
MEIPQSSIKYLSSWYQAPLHRTVTLPVNEILNTSTPRSGESEYPTDRVSRMVINHPRRRRTLLSNDLSLKLSKVRLSDSGTYRCFIPKQSKESTVQLIVGSVSSPVIAGINISSIAAVLQCESEGWYPEPEVLWLDGEGNLLSAGPSETVRGPDDLYTVSSRVTVEKRHSNSFTCRVQQKNTNQTRETEIEINRYPVDDTEATGYRQQLMTKAKNLIKNYRRKEN